MITNKNLRARARAVLLLTAYWSLLTSAASAVAPIKDVKISGSASEIESGTFTIQTGVTFTAAAGSTINLSAGTLTLPATLPASSGVNLTNITGANIVWSDNVRITHNPGANAAGVNVGAQAGNPDTPVNGDLWYDSTANALKARINGATVPLGASGATAFTALTDVPSSYSGQGSKLVAVNSGATALEFITAATGAPTGATYITQTAEGGLSAEQALSALATGILKNTTSTGVLSIATAGTDYVSPSSSETLTNKTLDASGTGNTIKLKGYLYLTHPHLADGTGATIGTIATALAYGHATFSNSADEAANYVEYRLQVPTDIDTSVEWRAKLKVRLTAADTGTHRYVLSTVTQADSASATGSPASAINLDFAGDASGASGDVETLGYTTLTGWAATMTADRLLVIRMARDGNASQDASTVDSTELGLVLEYGISQ